MMVRTMSRAVAIAMVATIGLSALAFSPTAIQASDYTAKDLGVKAISVENTRGLASFTVSVNKNGVGERGVADATGKVIIPTASSTLPIFFDTLGYAFRNGKLYDMSGNVHDFSKLGDVDYGYGIVLDRETLKTYDASGKEIGNIKPAGLDVRYDLQRTNDGVKNISEGGTFEGVVRSNIGEDGYITLRFYDAGKQLPGRCYVVDKTGKVIVGESENYASIGVFSDGVTWANKNGSEYSLAFIDKTGKKIATSDTLAKNRYLYDFVNGQAMFGDNALSGIIDKTGKVLLPAQYESILTFASKQVFLVQKGGKWGKVDVNGKVLIPFEYDYCYGGNSDATIIAFRKNGKCGYTDGNGNVLVPFEYSNISAYKKGVGYGVKDGKVYAITIPNAETALSELAVSDAEVGVLVSWTGAADATGYRVYRSEKQGERGELVYEGRAQPTEFVDVNAKPNTKYFYTVFKLTGGAKTETPMVFEKGVGMIATGEIRGSERVGTKGYLLMKVDSPTMSVNGVVTEIDPGRGTTPKNIGGRVIMPIRAAIEAMGGTADWNDAERKITLKRGATDIEMRLGEKAFTVNGKAFALDVPPQIMNGRTMLPIRFVAENIGCEIAWVGSTKEVVVVFWQN